MSNYIFCYVFPLAVPAGKQTNNDSTVTEGKPATMSVNLMSNFARAVSQSLPATFTWKNPQDRTIFNGSNYTITSNDFWSELVIHKVTVSDNGTFKCEAENFMGISTFFFQLRIQQGEVWKYIKKLENQLYTVHRERKKETKFIELSNELQTIR